MFLRTGRSPCYGGDWPTIPGIGTLAGLKLVYRVLGNVFMSENLFGQLQDQLHAGGASAVFDRLAASLREQREYHKLFDALCLKKKYELGAPLNRPTSFDDVPAARRDEFESAYVAAAREVGQLLLADKKLSQSFVYFHALRETQPIRDAIEAVPMPRESNEESEELIDLAFYKLIHPVKGMQIMLKTHGTCSTITALDQGFMNLSPEQRSACAALLVRTLHGDLLQSVQREVKQRMPFAEPARTQLSHRRIASALDSSFRPFVDPWSARAGFGD
jgi:hypothetical protein